MAFSIKSLIYIYVLCSIFNISQCEVFKNNSENTSHKIFQLLTTTLDNPSGCHSLGVAKGYKIGLTKSDQIKN